MQSNFNKSLEMLLAHEGGFSNHSQDPGGVTNLGVTARVWEEWVGHPVDEKQMRALTPKDVAPLYKRKYGDACRADELVSGLDYAVFDFAVNSGVGRAVKTLQACVGVNADGGFGSTTMAAVSLFKGNSAKVIITEVCDNRLNFLKSLKTFAVFGKGWENRVNSVKAQALKMLG
jgi:lysozyme family protein